jgi:transcription termination/antitermination protein NusG
MRSFLCRPWLDLSKDGEAMSAATNKRTDRSMAMLDSAPARGPAVPERKWFAVYTNWRHEAAVSRKLRMLEVETFLPVYRCQRRWRNGCHRVLDLPLFSNYLFVRIGHGERGRVLGMPGVVALVGSGSQPVPVPDLEIERLRELTAKSLCEPHPYLTIGQRVRIHQGPMRGLEGILVRKKGAHQLVLNVDSVMQGVAVRIDASEIEPLPGS